MLVVDDDPLVLRTLTLMLREGGFEPLECDAGESALQIVAARKVDLVLLDLVMPRMNGLDVCKQIKATSTGKSIPVLFLTAQGDITNIVNGLDAGADGYLEKPIELPELVARLRAMLRFQGAQRSSAVNEPPSLQDLLNERVAALSAASGLSRREQEVLELLLLGRTVSDIGLVLGITPRTAKFHQTNVLNKLGAESRFDLMRLLL